MNDFVIHKMASNKKIIEDGIVNELGSITDRSRDGMLSMYNKCISLHQSRLQGNGKFLEDIVSEILDRFDVSYKRQITLDKSGVIVGTNIKKRCYHIVDFVIGDCITIGKNISEYIVLSCKTTCRERWTQDQWAFSLCPKLYILLTTSTDYPPSNRFREDDVRKIISCFKKKNDDRIYKLTFDDLVYEILK
jgi:hypothetical protein